MAFHAAPKTILVGLASLFVCGLALITYSMPGSGNRVALEGVRTSQMDFSEFMGMCKHSCRKNEEKLSRLCTGDALSRHWLDYTQSCDKHKANCHIPTMGCGGAWRFEDVN